MREACAKGTIEAPLVSTAGRAGQPQVVTSRVAVLVVAMQCSGASALTRILSLRGCGLPKTLMGAASGNDFGHWESGAIRDLNDAISESAGSVGHDWTAFNPEWHASLVAEEFRERAQVVLHQEFGNRRLFVLKDSRICRFLEFWTEAIEAFGATPVLVSPIRNPADVAASLQARDGTDPAVGQLLWLRHVLDAEAASRHLKRAYVRYDDLFGEAEAVADRLGEKLGVSWPRRSTAVDMEIDEFVAQTLRHHRHNDSGVLKNPHLSRWAQSSFEILDRWAHGKACGREMAELDRIKAAFDDAAPAFSRAIAAGQQAGERDRARGRTGAVSERDSRLGDEQAAMARMETLAGELARTLASVAQLTDEMAGKDQMLASTRAALEQEQARSQWLQNEWDAAQAKVDELNRSSHHWWTVADGFINEWDAAKAKVDELNRSSHHWWTVADHLSQELQSVYASKSWRITWPLRQTMALINRLVHLLKRTARSFLAALMAFVLRRERLQRRALTWLNRYPGIKERLRGSARARGLVAQPPPVAISEPVSTGSATDTQAHVPAGADDVGSVDLKPLSPRARRIYADLKTAIARRQKENG